MNQTSKQMMNHRQQKTKIISMLLIETLFCLPSSGKMVKHIAKLLNILLALFLEGMEKALESLIGMTKPSTKDMVHLRHAVKQSPRGVLFSDTIYLQSKEDRLSLPL